ncbi:DNA sulfur modification protein DndB [Roseofilum sp. BLCC_M154]|uniref:DNA sulfur modification protein DndB n=1 Tax=Roseofilum acuticapitatum BLCC-M154 TaxID=3022444 RepID=A0ABT7ANZ3_9CYAN|nr:DNA sulfur modification protein DndB [Roseofilum acuticapitatum]MDJ1168612.1 DNA sulfur modification protein DndB [Roseofilum acuticapitatum BLCC-M154]
MSTDSDHPTEELLNLDQVLGPYFAEHHEHRCYPALVLHQGNREMLQINVPADHLTTLLQAKPSTKNDPDSGKNRPEIQGHVKEIKEYIQDRVKNNKPWILGTITANVDPSQIQIIKLGRGVGIAVIPKSVKLDITDGQHRIRAIHELYFSSDYELVCNDYFPITLVLEGDLKQCQIDFRDMAKTRQLDKALLLSFGEYEGVIGITKNLIESVPMFKDKTEKIKKTPATKQKLIYTTNYIAKFVSCAFADDASKELKDYNVESSCDTLIKCCNEFFSNCSNTQYIFNMNIRDLTIEDVQKFQEYCILSKSAGLEVLGRLLYHTYDTNTNIFDSQRVGQLAQLDWSISSNLWQDNLVRLQQNPKNPSQPYRILPGRNGVKLAVDHVRQQLGWLDHTPLF